MSFFPETLGNIAWWHQNEREIREWFPPYWDHITQDTGLKIGFRLKVLGVDWRDEKTFGKIMDYIRCMGIYEYDPDSQMVRQHGHSIFDPLHPHDQIS